MLYLNLFIDVIEGETYINLTLTSVVFELMKFMFWRYISTNLTLTSVVFESANIIIWDILTIYLTLTSVVFEFC